MSLSGEPFDEPVAAITFDDGYRDVYEHAFPVLKRKGIPAAVFVVTDLVGQPVLADARQAVSPGRQGVRHVGRPAPRAVGADARARTCPTDTDRTREATRTPLSRCRPCSRSLSMTSVRSLMDGLEASVGNGFHNIPRTLDWPSSRTMRRGGITIGSHTKSHVSLPAESSAVVADELEGSKQALEAQLGEPVAHFAYPGGQFTHADRRGGRAGRIPVRLHRLPARRRAPPRADDRASAAVGRLVGRRRRPSSRPRSSTARRRTCGRRRARATASTCRRNAQRASAHGSAITRAPRSCWSSAAASAWRRRSRSASSWRACSTRRCSAPTSSSSWSTPRSTACCSSAWPRASTTSSRAQSQHTGRYVCQCGRHAHGGRPVGTGALYLARTAIAGWLTPELAGYVVPLGLFLTFTLASTVLEIVMVSRQAALEGGDHLRDFGHHAHSAVRHPRARVRQPSRGVHRRDGVRGDFAWP